MSKQNKQPLLQRPAVVGVLASLLSIVIGLVLGFVLLVLLNPGASVGGMKAMMTTGFSSMDKLGKVLYQAAPLMMCGLSVGFAFKTGLFNIGASGQYTMGAFFALLCAIQFQMPWFVCLLAGAVGGAIWGIFPGLFKAYFNVNEVITAIMFNWIGMYLVNLLLASSNPIGTIFSALFISYIQVGGAAMQPAYSSETIDIVIAVIIYLAAFALLMRGVIAKAVSGRKEKGGAAK